MDVLLLDMHCPELSRICIAQNTGTVSIAFISPSKLGFDKGDAENILRSQQLFTFIPKNMYHELKTPIEPSIYAYDVAVVYPDGSIQRLQNNSNSQGEYEKILATAIAVSKIGNFHQVIRLRSSHKEGAPVFENPDFDPEKPTAIPEGY